MAESMVSTTADQLVAWWVASTASQLVLTGVASKADSKAVRRAALLADQKELEWTNRRRKRGKKMKIVEQGG
jgi:hypothetical protein